MRWSGGRMRRGLRPGLGRVEEGREEGEGGGRWFGLFRGRVIEREVAGLLGGWAE